ncbi:MAG: hypothetical protein DRJ49_00645 [Thermoprotei archaeon]|nr:MAG: hypothetical protein DRJ49_00645 [Thermoprotei archaeon]
MYYSAVIGMNIGLVNIIRNATIVAVLFEGSREDLKFREIRDELWIIGAMLCAPLVILYYTLIPSGIIMFVLITHIFSIAIGIIIAIVLAMLGFMGGGDAKAYMFLSIFEPPALGTIEVLPPSLSIMINSIVVSLTMTLYILMKNLKNVRKYGIFKRFKEPLLKRVAVLFLAYEEDVKKVKKEPWKYFISEDLSSRDKFILIYRIPEKEDIVNNLSDNDRILVSPAIPMLVFIFIGYIIYLLYGNIVLVMLDRLLRTGIA